MTLADKSRTAIQKWPQLLEEMHWFVRERGGMQSFLRGELFCDGWVGISVQSVGYNRLRSRRTKKKTWCVRFVSVFRTKLSAEQLQSNERKCWTNCAWPWSTAPLPNFTVKIGRAHRMFQSTNNLGDRLQLFRPRTSREVPHGHHFVLGFPWISFHDSSE